MKTDLYDNITARILEQLDKGSVPWRKPWANYGTAAMPRNAISKRPYSGVNVPLLWIERDDKGYRSNDWLTYKQAAEAGGNVRKGEKAAQVVFFKQVEITDKETGDLKRIPLLRGFNVFNVDQCENLPLSFPEPKAINPDARNVEAEEFIRSTGATVTHGESRAYYSTAQDRVNLPLFEAFKGAEEYYSTAFHELTHWTGHKSRLDRTMGKRFGDHGYAVEELVAELGAAFLCAEFGFDNTNGSGCGTFENSAAYIDHWRKVIKADAKIFASAAAAASKAASYMRDLTLADAASLAA